MWESTEGRTRANVRIDFCATQANNLEENGCRAGGGAKPVKSQVVEDKKVRNNASTVQ